MTYDGVVGKESRKAKTQFLYDESLLVQHRTRGEKKAMQQEKRGKSGARPYSSAVASRESGENGSGNDGVGRHSVGRGERFR